MCIYIYIYICWGCGVPRKRSAKKVIFSVRPAPRCRKPWKYFVFIYFPQKKLMKINTFTYAASWPSRRVSWSKLRCRPPPPCGTVSRELRFHWFCQEKLMKLNTFNNKSNSNSNKKNNNKSNCNSNNNKSNSKRNSKSNSSSSRSDSKSKTNSKSNRPPRTWGAGCQESIFFRGARHLGWCAPESTTFLLS